MSVTEALAKASAKPAGHRPYFLSPDIERVMAIAMAIAQELAVTRARLDTIERILENKSILYRKEIDAFEPTKDEAAERGLWTQEYLTRILRILQQEAEAIDAAAQGDLASEEVAVEVAKSDT